MYTNAYLMTVVAVKVRLLLLSYVLTLTSIRNVNGNVNIFGYVVNCLESKFNDATGSVFFFI